MRKKNAAIVIQTASDTTEFASVDIDKTFIAYDSSIFPDISALHFDSDYWKSEDAVTGFAKGRGTTWFVKHRQQHLVLRHYFRGGMIGKLLRDQYLFTGLRNSRAYREFELLAKLRQLALPVPAPVAIKITRKSLFYCTNDIITARIKDSDSLSAILSLRSINDNLWQTIGTTIRRFHDHKVYHHDLNAHNLLIDPDESLWLIDFDQCEIRSHPGKWQQENLERLKRSLLKEQKLNPAFHFHQRDWVKLVEAYDKI